MRKVYLKNLVYLPYHRILKEYLTRFKFSVILLETGFKNVDYGE